MKSLVAMVLATICSLAAAQDYPSKPIRILVPFAPGGAVDTTARILTQKMTERLNWNFVVENRPGGNGFIATTAVKDAPGDGYTLLMAHTGEFSVNPGLFPNVPYDLERDFVAVGGTLEEIVTQPKIQPVVLFVRLEVLPPDFGNALFLL